MNNVLEIKIRVGRFFTYNMFQPSQVNLDQGRKNGNFAKWPGLTAERIAKHIPKYEATVLGHLDQTQNTPDQQKVSI